MQDIITLQIGRTKERSSNFELYRIICMLMIVAHHFVVNSGLTSLMMENPTAANTLGRCPQGLFTDCRAGWEIDPVA